jgi:hypothetical protein
LQNVEDLHVGDRLSGSSRSRAKESCAQPVELPELPGNFSYISGPIFFEIS